MSLEATRRSASDDLTYPTPSIARLRETCSTLERAPLAVASAMPFPGQNTRPEHIREDIRAPCTDNPSDGGTEADAATP